jgi:hypothetical protein
MSDLPQDSAIAKQRGQEVQRLSLLKQWPHDYDVDDGGVLLSDHIRRYSEQFDLISPFDVESLRPAGYDLRVGSNYSIRGERKALNEGMEFEIGPYQVAVIETFETLNLPRFLIGRWNIRVKHAYKGCCGLAEHKWTRAFEADCAAPSTISLRNQCALLSKSRSQ